MDGFEKGHTLDESKESQSPGAPGAESNEGQTGHAPEPPAAESSFDPNDYLLRSYGMTETQLRQTIEWARQMAQAVQSGRVRLQDAEAAAQPAQQAQEAGNYAQVWEQWDELSERDRARYLAEIAKWEAKRELAQEVQRMREELGRQAQAQAAQLQLAMRSIKLASEHGVPFDEIIVEATKLASLTPDQLLQQALEAKLQPKKVQEQVQKLVEQELAKRLQEMQNREAESVMPGVSLPSWLRGVKSQEQDSKNPIQRQIERRLRILEQLKKSA